MNDREVVNRIDGKGANSTLADYVLSLRERYQLRPRVLLVQTLQFQMDSFNLDIARARGYYAFPPTGLQCLAKVLRGMGIEVDILDLNFEFLKKVVEDAGFDPSSWLGILDQWLALKKPSIVGVTCIGVSVELLKETHPLTAVLNHLRRKDEYVLMAGGALATDEHEGYLSNDLCHFVVAGEAENKVRFLFGELIGLPQANRAVPGIYFRYNGRIVETRGSADKVELCGNLIETYRDIPVEDYHKVGSLNPFSRMAGMDKPLAAIQLNRGCRCNCKFCGVPKFMGKGVRQYPHADVLEEILYLIEERGVRHLEILDDDFLGPSSLKAGLEGLLKAMIPLKRKYGLSWSAANGLIASSITSDLMRLISDSGCTGFRIGIESANEDMLKRIRKPVSLQGMREFAAMLKDYPDVFVCGNYIIGFFGEETFGQILDTYRFASEVDLDSASIATYQFTSKTTTRCENLKHDGKAATEFVPSKDVTIREVREAAGVRVGMDIFKIPDEEIPSREQVREIWFVFNLLTNYINNKHFKPGGNPRKMLSWLLAIQVTYPQNPYIALFSGLAHLLCGEPELASGQRGRVVNILFGSGYWRERFSQFALQHVLDHFPASVSDVYIRMDEIRLRLQVSPPREIHYVDRGN